MSRGFGGLLAALAVSACATYSQPPPREAESYANFLVGRVANSRDDHDAASDRYVRALQASPHDSSILDEAVSTALAAGDVERARAAIRIAPRAVEQSPYALLLRASDALVAGRWRHASAQLEGVRGGPAEALSERVMSLWAQVGAGEIDQTIAELGPLDAASPYGGVFAFQSALALDYAGRNADARAAYQRSYASGSWVALMASRYADLLARAGAKDAAIEVLQRAEAWRANPALAAASVRLRAGEAVEPTPLTPARGAALGLYNLAVLFSRDADSARALAAMTLALNLDPDLESARVAFAESQVDLHQYDRARIALARISPQSPYAMRAKVIETWILMDEGRGDDAVASARANVEAGGGAEAERALADLYRNLERYGEAEPIYSRLIASEGAADWRLYFARGVARERLNRWTEAEADLRRALDLAPEQPEVLNYLGYTWVDRGERLEEGLAMIQRAVELRPTSGAIIDSLGWAYFRMERFDQSLEALERAVELEPADPILNDHLGDVYWRVGRRIEARFQWRRALMLDPAEADRPVIEAKLEHGMPDASATRVGAR